MTRTWAKLLILIGWSYSIMLALALAISPNEHHPYNVRCHRNEIPQTVARVSGIIVISSLVIIQVKTVLILKVRFQLICGPGSTGISAARLHLYKRVMMTAGYRSSVCSHMGTLSYAIHSENLVTRQ